MIIFLNGNSSAGKSTLARQIMRLSERPYIYYSIDHLINFWMDEKFVAIGKEPQEWFHHESIIDNSGNILSQVVDGPRASQLHWDMIDSLAVLISKGYDLIIDEVLWSDDIFYRYAPALMKSNKVYLVNINCNLITCEERESAREDRYQGLARTLYPKVNRDFPFYDLQVDTSYIEPAKNAENILKYVDDFLQPQAYLRSIYKLITFSPLQTEHFPLLQYWLNQPHVKQWWDDGVEEWTLEAITQKYQSYVKGYKTEKGKKKAIHGYVAFCARQPFAYIQCYNAYDFPRDGYELKGFPSSLATIDLYIGDSDYMGKGVAPSLIKLVLEQIIWPRFSACFVDPHSNNKQAIRAYEKAGFKIECELRAIATTLMLQLNPEKRLKHKK